jgi:hypothetical protein
MGIPRDPVGLQTGLPAAVEVNDLGSIGRPPRPVDLAVYAASQLAVAREFPPGSAVPVLRERLLELLELAVGEQGLGTGADHLPDLRVEDVAKRVRRAPSTVRQWCHDGEFDMPVRGQGAYKHNGKEWLIPEVALAAYQERQRVGGGSPRDKISDWKRVKSIPKRRRNDAA